MQILRLAAAVALLLLATSHGRGADITKVSREGCDVSLTGPIERGDLEKLRQLATAHGMLREAFIDEKQTFVCLDSPGGSYLEGLLISEFLIKYAIGTRIEKGSSCASSCAFIFMSGTSRGEDWDNPRRLLHVGGRLGFHAPYLSLTDVRSITAREAEQTVDTLNRMMSGFLRIFSHNSGFYTDPWIRGSLVSEMLSKGRDELLLVDTVQKAGRWDITLYGMKVIKQATKADVIQLCHNFQAWVNDKPSRAADRSSPDPKRDPKTGYYRVDQSGMEELYCDVAWRDTHFRICTVDDYAASNKGRCPDKYWIQQPYLSKPPETLIRSLE